MGLEFRVHTVRYEGFITPKFEGNVTKFAPLEALK